MKSASRKGLPAAKGFAKYTGNVKGGSTKLPSGTRTTPKGGKVSSNANSKTKVTPKKLKG